MRQLGIEGYRIDPRTRRVLAPDGEPVAMSGKAFDVLLFLVEHRDRVVSKDDLLAAVWPGRIIEENTLTQAISLARRALGSNASDHRHIVTLPGRGYRFVADVVEVNDGSVQAVEAGSTAFAQAVANESQAHPDTSPVRTRPARRSFLLLALLLAVLAAVAFSRWREPAVPAAGPAVGPPVALAVLPFRALAGDAGDDSLELGMADTLITRLSRSSALQVRSLESSTRSGIPQGDARQVGLALGATYVVAGTTQVMGTNVRVNARLIRVAEGTTVWADTFDSPLARVFTLQDAIAGAVTSALEVQPILVPARAQSPCDGEDPQAYRAWLRGHYLLQRPNHANLAGALHAFRGALDRDATCTRAYAGMALAYRGQAHLDRDPREAFPLAKAAVAQALQLDPESAMALMAQGRNQHLYDWNWAGAEDSFKKALARNPSLMEAHFAYAHLLVNLGRFDEGIARARQGLALDPLSPMLNALAGGFYTAAQQPQAATAQVNRALELQPDFWVALLVRGGMALDRGDTSAAIADLDRAVERSQRTSQTLAVLAAVKVAAGQRYEAEAILRELETRDVVDYVPATSLAAVHNALGDTGAALFMLERAYEQRDIRLGFLGIDARWNNLRGEPRFKALAQRMGLPNARAYGRF